MELTIKMHETTISISTDNDEMTLTEIYDHFNAMLIGCTFTQKQIDNYIVDKAIEIEQNDTIAN
jgi:hypothetical protein